MTESRKAKNDSTNVVVIDERNITRIVNLSEAIFLYRFGALAFLRLNVYGQWFAYDRCGGGQ
jgi:hypothetical protein